MMKKTDRLVRVSFVAALFLAVFFSLASTVFAAVKDTDADGLTDEGEVTTYLTDPNNADTDGDGISDGQEVINGTDPLDADDRIPQASDFSDPGILGKPEQFPWFFSRAAGILAFILLTASSAFGLVISSRAFQKVFSGGDAYEFHRTISILSVFAVIAHFASLLFDRAFGLSFLDTLVPFHFAREGAVSATGFDLRLPIAFGIVAFYLIVLLVVTAEYRSKMPPKTWRIVHYASFAAYPLFLLHGFMSGTDSREGWMRVIYALSATIMIVLIFVRIVSRSILPGLRRFRVEHRTDPASPDVPSS